jgi:hypothetical protein
MGNGNNQGNMMNPEQEKLWEKYKLAELAGSTSSPQAAREGNIVTLRIPSARAEFEYHRARALSYCTLKLLAEACPPDGVGERLVAQPSPRLRRASPDDYVFEYEVTDKPVDGRS